MANDATVAARTSAALGIVGEFQLNGADYLIINLEIETNQSQLAEITSFMEVLR